MFFNARPLSGTLAIILFVTVLKPLAYTSNEIEKFIFNERKSEQNTNDGDHE